MIELNGAGTGASADGLVITAGNSTIKGLIINRFGLNGIVLSTNGGNTIQGCYIGTAINGLAALGNGASGIRIVSSGTNTIGGTTATARNVVSGNNDDGIKILSGSGNTIRGNYIGTNANGNGALANTASGIYMDSANNVIGGNVAGVRNIISGNSRYGVYMAGSQATNNTVQGNYIGTDLNGTADIGNLLYGVEINGAANNTIGGDTPPARNVISGNDNSGVQIFGVFSTGNTVLGNYIGTNKDGTTAELAARRLHHDRRGDQHARLLAGRGQASRQAHTH